MSALKKVAFVAFDDCALWQVALLQKLLTRAGWKVDTITVGGENVRTDGGLGLVADYALEYVGAQDYSLLLLPGLGGEIPERLLENEALKRFVQSFTGLIAASCASALFIASAGRLTGNFTTMPHVKEKYEEYFSQGTYLDQHVCIDQQLITSKGFAHIEFMLKVLEELGLFKEDPRLEGVALHLSKMVSEG